MTSEQRGHLLAIIGMVSVVGIVFGLTGPLLNLLLERQAITTRAIGFNSSMMALGTLVITPLVPRFLAHMRPTQFLYWCLGSAIVLLLLLKLWPVFEFWLLIRFLMGSAVAGLFVVSETWINFLVTDANRGRILGIYAACLSAGFGLGPLLIEFTGIDGWAPFVAGAALIGAAAVILAITNPKAPEFPTSHSGGLWQFLRNSPIAIMAGLLYGALETGVFGLMPVFGVRIGLTEATAAQMLTAVALGNILLQYPIGWLADKYNPYAVLGLCATIGIAGALSLNMPAGSVLLWPVLIIWGGTITGLYTVGLTILGRTYSSLKLTGANAAIVSAYGMGALISPSFLGTAMDINDPYGLAWGLAILSASLLLVLAIFWRKTSPFSAPAGLD